MYLIKPIIVKGGGSAIELADNLTTTTKGKALDASQGKLLLDNITVIDRDMEQHYAKKTDIPTVPDLTEYAKKTDIPKYSIMNAGIKLPLRVELTNVVTGVSLGSLDIDNGVLHSRFDLNSGQMYKITITVTTSGPSGLLFFTPIPNVRIDIGCGISSVSGTMTIPLICRESFTGKDYNLGYIYAFIK